MEKVNVFEYLILYRPTKDEVKEGKQPEIIQDVEIMIASNQNTVVMKAAKSIPSEYENKLDQIDIVIRPF